MRYCLVSDINIQEFYISYCPEVDSASENEYQGFILG